MAADKEAAPVVLGVAGDLADCRDPARARRVRAGGCPAFAAPAPGFAVLCGVCQSPLCLVVQVLPARTSTLPALALFVAKSPV